MKEFIVPANEFEEEIARTAGYKELIRCKDCRHYEPLTQSCTEDDGIMMPDFYCGLGEKKDGEQE